MGNLKSMEVRRILSEHLVAPFLGSDKRMVAVRLSWFNQSQTFLNGVYEQLAPLRTQLDQHVRDMPGCLMHLSAITATKSAIKKDRDAGDMKIYPGVAYYVIMDDEKFNQRDVCNYLQGTQLGLTMKLLLQPYQQTKADVEKALWIVLKDTMEGCVRRMVDYSAQLAYRMDAGQYSIARAYAHDHYFNNVISEIKNKLESVRFTLQVD